MFCRKCGTEIPNDSIFCQKCGEMLANVSSEQINSQGSKTVISETEPTLIDQWLDKANQRYRNKDYDYAQKAAERVIEVEPNNTNAHDILYNILIEKSTSSDAAFKENFKEAVNHAVVVATNVPSLASSYMVNCTNIVHDRVEIEVKYFRSLSHYSLLPGMSEWSHAVKDAAKYYYILEAMAYIFRIPNAAIETATQCYEAMYSMQMESCGILFMAENMYCKKFDRNYSFINTLNTQTLKNYPTLNIRN